MHFLMRINNNNNNNIYLFYMYRLARLTEVVPDVHLSTQRSHFDDLLAKKVVRLARELGAQSSLEVVVLVPEQRDDEPDSHRVQLHRTTQAQIADSAPGVAAWEVTSRLNERQIETSKKEWAKEGRRKKGKVREGK